MIAPTDFICLSHLRWNFVYQRPNHLMSRAAREHRVFFIEEPELDGGLPRLETSEVEPQLMRVVPRIPRDTPHEEQIAMQRAWLDELMEMHGIESHVLWFYTPMALDLVRHLDPAAVVFDCMDELSGFKNAPALLREREAELLTAADVVFTGGQSLYEAKQHRHPNVHAFPSSVDASHFERARTWIGAPEDQASIPRPRIGYFGVIDERLDLELIRGVAEARPDWQLMMLGPVVKIDEASLPRLPNIHYLGKKDYAELPAYLAGWDVGMMPFALNDATRYISPTKTPEYLAAGKPVVSTPIRDVVRPYGERGLVKIAGTLPEMIAAIESTLAEIEDGAIHRQEADRFLAEMSWDITWQKMMAQIRDVMAGSGRREEARDKGRWAKGWKEKNTCLII